jgi:DNA/RNA-binding domain of Phe-tRNA-synthetase-like protein
MNITISESLRKLAPQLVLGSVEADVVYEKKNDELWKLLEARGRELAGALRGAEAGTVAEFDAARRAYRALGKDPSRYRGSAEALFRRLQSGRGLYQVNNIVDVNNLVSLETRHPVGAYDVANTADAVSFRVGAAGEEYAGIGKETINLEGLPVFADERGPFGSPTSDSRRAMIMPNTSRVCLVIIAFSGPDGLDAALEQAGSYLEKYASARNVARSRSDT